MMLSFGCYLNCIRESNGHTIEMSTIHSHRHCCLLAPPASSSSYSIPSMRFSDEVLCSLRRVPPQLLHMASSSSLPEPRTVLLRGLSPQATEAELRDILGYFGEVHGALCRWNICRRTSPPFGPWDK